MNKFSKILGKIIAGILAVLLVVITVSSLLLLAVERQVLNPDYYQRALEREQIYQQAPKIAAAQLYESINAAACDDGTNRCQDGPPSYFQALTEEDWEILLAELLPADWLESQVNGMIDSLLAFEESGGRNLQLTISTLEVKERLSGEAGVAAIVNVLEGQPECSDDDILAMTRILEGRDQPGQDFLSCRPSDQYIEKHSPQLEVILRRSLRDIPDEVVLSEEIFDQGQVESGDRSWGEVLGYQLPAALYLQWVRWLIWMIPALSGLLLILMAFFAAHSLKDLSVWWGYPVLISGLIALGLAFLVEPLANWLTGTFLKGRELAGIHPLVLESGSGLAVQLLRLLLAKVRRLALIVLGIGLVMLVVPPLFAPQAEDGDQENEQPESDSVQQETLEEEAPPETGQSEES